MDVAQTEREEGLLRILSRRGNELELIREEQREKDATINFLKNRIATFQNQNRAAASARGEEFVSAVPDALPYGELQAELRCHQDQNRRLARQLDQSNQEVETLQARLAEARDEIAFLWREMHGRQAGTVSVQPEGVSTSPSASKATSAFAGAPFATREATVDKVEGLPSSAEYQASSGSSAASSPCKRAQHQTLNLSSSVPSLPASKGDADARPQSCAAWMQGAAFLDAECGIPGAEAGAGSRSWMALPQAAATGSAEGRQPQGSWPPRPGCRAASPDSEESPRAASGIASSVSTEQATGTQRARSDVGTECEAADAGAGAARILSPPEKASRGQLVDEVGLSYKADIEVICQAPGVKDAVSITTKCDNAPPESTSQDVAPILFSAGQGGNRSNQALICIGFDNDRNTAAMEAKRLRVAKQMERRRQARAGRGPSSGPECPKRSQDDSEACCSGAELDGSRSKTRLSHGSIPSTHQASASSLPRSEVAVRPGEIMDPPEKQSQDDGNSAQVVSSPSAPILDRNQQPQLAVRPLQLEGVATVPMQDHGSRHYTGSSPSSPLGSTIFTRQLAVRHVMSDTRNHVRQQDSSTASPVHMQMQLKRNVQDLPASPSSMSRTASDLLLSPASLCRSERSSPSRFTIQQPVLTVQSARDPAMSAREQTTLHSRFADLRDEMKRRRSNAISGPRPPGEALEVAEAVIAEANANVPPPSKIAIPTSTFSPPAGCSSPCRPPLGSCVQRLSLSSCVGNYVSRSACSLPPSPSSSSIGSLGANQALVMAPASVRSQMPAFAPFPRGAKVGVSSLSPNERITTTVAGGIHSPPNQQPQMFIPVGVSNGPACIRTLGSPTNKSGASSPSSPTGGASSRSDHAYVAQAKSQPPLSSSPMAGGTHLGGRLRHMSNQQDAAPGIPSTRSTGSFVSVADLDRSRGQHQSGRLSSSGTSHGASVTNISVVGDVANSEPDPVHEAMVLFWLHRQSSRHPMVRNSRGVYLYGNKKLVVAIHNEKLMVRIGGGFVNLESYLLDVDRGAGVPAGSGFGPCGAASARKANSRA